MRKFLFFIMVITGSAVVAPPVQAGMPDPNDFTLSLYSYWCAPSSHVPEPPLSIGTSLFAALNSGPGTSGGLPGPTLVVAGNENGFTMEFEWTGVNYTTAGAAIFPRVEYWAVANCNVIPFGAMTLAPPLPENCPVMSIVNDGTTPALQSSVVTFELEEQGDPVESSSWAFTIALPNGVTFADASITVSVDTCLGADGGDEGSGVWFSIDPDFLNRSTPDELPNTGSGGHLALVATVLMALGGVTRTISRRARA